MLSIMMFILVAPVMAAQNNGVGLQTGSGSQQTVVSPTKAVVPSKTISPTGNRVQNQVQTQNQGEDSQIQVGTQENLGSEVGNSMDSRSETAIKHMSEVAKQVQGILQLKISGGIGDQVRIVAREQTQAQDKIQENMTKMESKNPLLKKLFGPDYNSIKALNQLIEENNTRIQQLEELLIQVQNYSDKTQIQETIQSIINQNTALQERIQAETQIGSLFGWFVRFFN